MIDGADLAAAIVAHPNDIERAFAAYEATMFPRAQQAAAESAAGLELAFEANAPQAMLDFFTPRDEMIASPRRNVWLRGGVLSRCTASIPEFERPDAEFASGRCFRIVPE